MFKKWSGIGAMFVKWLPKEFKEQLPTPEEIDCLLEGIE